MDSNNENDEDIGEVILKKDDFVQDDATGSEDEDGLQHLHDCPKLELH